MIGTRPLSKLSIDRSADSTLVAFESLTNRTPPTSADELHRMLETGERLDRRGHRDRRRAGDRADRCRRHHVGHEMRTEQMNRVERNEAAERPTATDPRSSRRRSTVPSASAVCRDEQSPTPRPRRANSSTDGSSALITAQSPLSWFSKIRALAAA